MCTAQHKNSRRLRSRVPKDQNKLLEQLDRVERAGGIRLFTNAKKELAVQFRVIQHQGFENRVAPEGAKIALQETLAELSRPKLQLRAVQGVRLSAKRLQANKGGDKTDFTIAIAGLDAFHRTFGVKSTELWSRLEGRPGLDQKRPGA